MAAPLPLNRRLLGDSGAALDEADYAQTIAGMGFVRIEPFFVGKQEQRWFIWNSRQFQRTLSKLGPRPPLKELLDRRDRWRSEVGGGKVTLVVEDGRRARRINDLIRVLSHPEAGTECVLLQVRAPDADLKWQWPMRIGAFPEDARALKLESLRRKWPSEKLTDPLKLSRDQARCDVLVLRGSIRDALKRILDPAYRIRAGFVILVGPLDFSWDEVWLHVGALLQETQAAGLTVFSPLPKDDFADLLNDWCRALSHNEPLTKALAKTFRPELCLNVIDRRLVEAVALPHFARRVGRRLKALRPDTGLSISKSLSHVGLDWKAKMKPADLGEELEAKAESVSYRHESDGADALSEIGSAEREARRESAHTEEPRFLQGDLYRFVEEQAVEESRGFIAGHSYKFDVFIGPPGQAKLGVKDPIDLRDLDWTTVDAHTLQVLFAEPSQLGEPLRGTLRLRREGKSEPCSFVFTPSKPGKFAGRVMVYYRGRILQTAILRAEVFADEKRRIEGKDGIAFGVETALFSSFSTLDDRRRFDACVMLNHGTDGTGSMTAAGAEGAYIASLDGIRAQLSTINQLLSPVAVNAKPYSEGLKTPKNEELLCRLAREGVWIFKNLVVDYLDHSAAAEAIRKSTHLQIVCARADDVVPLEFAYAYPPPPVDAPVCPNVLDALKNGECPVSCVPKDTPAPHVCPLGFWGLSKVIERHVHDGGMVQPAKVRPVDPIEGGRPLSLSGVTLLAASKEVTDAERQHLEQFAQAKWGKDALPAANWEEWKKIVKEKAPRLFVALPHAFKQGAEISLEIRGDTREALFINSDFVGKDPKSPPLVLLLGCDTAKVSDTEAYARYVSVFRQANASVILGTVATVLGTHAAELAESLLEALSEAAKKPGQRFGEILLQVKRDSLSKSAMIALCLVSFGDADWKLT